MEDSCLYRKSVRDDIFHFLYINLFQLQRKIFQPPNSKSEELDAIKKSINDGTVSEERRLIPTEQLYAANVDQNLNSELSLKSCSVDIHGSETHQKFLDGKIASTISSLMTFKVGL